MVITDDRSPEFLKWDEENDNVFLYHLEKTDYRDLLAAIPPDSPYYDPIYSSLTQEEIEALAVEPEKHYPLISNMQNDRLPYDEDTVNIVVLGDSFTWGQSMIDRNEVYWRLLETSLRAQGYNVRVYGVAMPNATSYDELRWLTETTMFSDLEPDLIVFGYLYNDPEAEANSPTREDRQYVRPKVDLFSALFGRFFPTISARLSLYSIAKTMYTSDGLCVGSDGITDIIYAPIVKGQCRRNFEVRFMAPLNRFAAQNDIPVILMPLVVDSGEILQKELYKPLHELCETYDRLRVYDMTHDFFHRFAARKHAANYRINPADFHLGTAMHYFYAQYMERFLKKDFCDLLGEPADRDLNVQGPIVNDAMPYKTLGECLYADDNVSEYRIEYPAAGNEFRIFSFDQIPYHLRLPLEKDHVAFSFAVPVDIEKIEIAADGAQNIELYYRRVNESLGYDDLTVTAFGSREGSVWSDVTDDRVTSLLIHAEFPDRDGGELTLKITRAS